MMSVSFRLQISLCEHLHNAGIMISRLRQILFQTLSIPGIEKQVLLIVFLLEILWDITFLTSCLGIQEYMFRRCRLTADVLRRSLTSTLALIVVFCFLVKVSLSGKAVKEDANQLSWTAKDEQEVKRYIIERSNEQNGQFEVVGVVNGNQAASASYIFTDSNPLKDGNVYRIRIEYGSGKFSYSNAILIRSKGETTIAAYPNPVKDC